MAARRDLRAATRASVAMLRRATKRSEEDESGVAGGNAGRARGRRLRVRAQRAADASAHSNTMAVPGDKQRLWDCGK